MEMLWECLAPIFPALHKVGFIVLWFYSWRGKEAKIVEIMYALSDLFSSTTTTNSSNALLFGNYSSANTGGFSGSSGALSSNHSTSRDEGLGDSPTNSYAFELILQIDCAIFNTILASGS
jgi:hypothetical protein